MLRLFLFMVLVSIFDNILYYFFHVIHDSQYGDHNTLNSYKSTWTCDSCQMQFEISGASSSGLGGMPNHDLSLPLYEKVCDT